MDRRDRKSVILEWLRGTMPSHRCSCDKDGAPRCSELIRGHSDLLTGVMFGLGSDIPACRPSVTHGKQRGGEKGRQNWRQGKKVVRIQAAFYKTRKQEH